MYKKACISLLNDHHKFTPIIHSSLQSLQSTPFTSLSSISNLRLDCLRTPHEPNDSRVPSRFASIRYIWSPPRGGSTLQTSPSSSSKSSSLIGFCECLARVWYVSHLLVDPCKHSPRERQRGVVPPQFVPVPAWQVISPHFYCFHSSSWSFLFQVEVRSRIRTLQHSQEPERSQGS